MAIRKHLLAVSLLTVATILVWSPGADGEFVWIDHVEIEEAGYRVTSSEDFKLIWTTSLDNYLERRQGEAFATGGYLRPIYALSISLDWWLWQDEPYFYHVENIAWHLFVVLCLYFLGRKLLDGYERAGAVSFFATLLFAVHPFNIHSVTWISGRKDTMCAAFSLVSLICLGNLLAEGSFTNWKRWLWGLLAAMSLSIALFCKELALVVPAFATIWTWYGAQPKSQETDRRFEFREVRKTFSSNKPATILMVVFWCLAFGAITYRRLVLGGTGLDESYAADSFAGNLATSARLFVTYVGGILAPISPTIVDRFRVTNEWTLMDFAALGFFAAVSGYFVSLVIRRKRIGIAACWFLVWLIPASGLVPLRHLYAERYLYPASWGLLLFVVLLVFEFAKRFELNRITFNWVQMTLFLIAIVFGLKAISSGSDYRSDRTLFEHAVNQNEDYVEGQYALALLDLENARYKLAAQSSIRALESANDPNYHSYWSRFGLFTNAGLAFFHTERLDKALACFLEARKSRPNNAISWFHVGLVYDARNQHAEAATHYEQALAILPEHKASRNKLGLLLLREHRFERCIEVMAPLLEQDPDDLDGLSTTGSAWLALGRFRKARPLFERLVSLRPSATNLAKLAWCQFRMVETSEDLKEARETMARARKRDPNDSVVRDVARMFGQ